MSQAHASQPQRLKLALLASGQGTNAEGIMRAAQAGRLNAEIVMLFSDHRDAPALARADAMGVPTQAFEPREFDGKAAYETALLEVLRDAQADVVVLAGYMRLVGPTLLEAYPSRIINTHPSLLPKYPGLNAVGQALADGASVTGITVHYVDAGMDTGPIIAQRHVPILPNDDHDTLLARLKRIENRFYPDTLASLLDQWSFVH